jgi:hypothetical protein
VRAGIQAAVEIAVLADVPSEGSGLGSSSADRSREEKFGYPVDSTIEHLARLEHLARRTACVADTRIVLRHGHARRAKGTSPRDRLRRIPIRPPGPFRQHLQRHAS